MPRPSNRDRLLRAGLQVVHERGFGAASVRDIVRAAGVPQGSFTNHWVSKEAFGLDVLDAYAAGMLDLLGATLGNAALAPADRLRAYVAALRAECVDRGVHCGCLLGNMSAEGAGTAIRLRVVEVFDAVRAGLSACVEDVVREGGLPADTECAALAGVILAVLQGAMLLAKAQGNAEPLDQAERLLFSHVLPVRRREAAAP